MLICKQDTKTDDFHDHNTSINTSLMQQRTLLDISLTYRKTGHVKSYWAVLSVCFVDLATGV